MAFDGEKFRGPGGVNVAECLRVADLVERSETFLMSTWVHPCGTPACIAGHLVGEQVRKVIQPLSAQDDEAGIAYMLDVGAPLLGIEREQARVLFMPWVQNRSIESWHIKGDWAAACLRKLAETGEVDWLGTKPQQGAQS